MGTILYYTDLSRECEGLPNRYALVIMQGIRRGAGLQLPDCGFTHGRSMLDGASFTRTRLRDANSFRPAAASASYHSGYMPVEAPLY